MRRLLLFLLLTLPALAGDVAFTANLKNFSSSPTDSYLLVSLSDCGAGNIPRVLSGANAGVKSLEKQQLDPDGTGLISSTITPTEDITCGVSTGTTRYLIEIYQRMGEGQRDKRIHYAYYTVGPGPFTLETADQNPSVPAPATANAVLKNPTATQNIVQPTGTSLQVTGAGGVDLTAAGFTRPVRRLAFASFPATCTAGQDRLQRSDPASPGQVDYVCNSGGNGWNLVGDGGGAPGGSSTQVQVNSSGSFAGDPGLTYNSGADLLSVASGIAIGPTASVPTPADAGTAANFGTLSVKTSFSETLSPSADASVGDVLDHSTLIYAPSVAAPNRYGYASTRSAYIPASNTRNVSALGAIAGVAESDGSETLNRIVGAAGYATRDGTGTSTLTAAGYFIAANFPTATTLKLSGTYGTATNLGTISTWTYGAYGLATNSGGTSPLNVGVFGEALVTGGTVTESVGVYAKSVVSGGTVTKNYGLKVPDVIGGAEIWSVWVGRGKAWFGDRMIIAPLDASASTVLALNPATGHTGKLLSAQVNSVEKASIDKDGNVTGASFIGPLTGNASTATALAANPTDCTAGQYATTIDAGGNLTCAQVGYAQISGTPTLYNQTIIDESTPLTQRASLKFTGAGVSCADDTDKTTCTIGGGSTALSSVTDPTAATTTWNFDNGEKLVLQGPTAGTVNLLELLAGTGDTSTNYMLYVETLGARNGVKLKCGAGATTSRVISQMNTSGVEKFSLDCDGNLIANTVDFQTIVMTNAAAPGTPSAGDTAFWTDSTDKVAKFKDDAGNVSLSVRPDAGASNNFLTGITSAGVVTKAQPSFSNLSGAATDAQIPNNITIDTAATANAGDSPTDFFGTNISAHAGFTSHQAATTDTCTATCRFVTDYAIPANALTAGMHVSILAQGLITTDAGGPTPTFSVEFCTVEGCATGTVTAVCPAAGLFVNANVTNGFWRIQCDVVVVSAGASGSIEAQGITANSNGSATANQAATITANINTATITLDTTVAQYATIRENAALSGDTVALRLLVVKGSK